MVITMEEYITKEEFESFIQDVSKMFFAMDVSIEVLAEHYCMVDKKEFEELCNKTAKWRIELDNKSKVKNMNKIENYPKKEE